MGTGTIPFDREGNLCQLFSRKHLGQEGQRVKHKFVVLLGLGFYVATILGNSCVRKSPGVPTIAYVDSVQGISFAIPVGWHVTPADYEVSHYVDVFLTVNNQISDFRLPSSWSLAREVRGGVEYPTDWGKCLDPGMVHFLFTYVGGPGAWPPHYGPSHFDKFEDALAKALEPSARRTCGDVDIYSLHFTKWSRLWEIVAWVKQPCTAQERKQVVDLLRSIRFRDTPIVSLDQAVGAAFHHLPAREQLGQWPAVSARNCEYETRAQAVANAYSVEFVLYSDGDPEQRFSPSTWV